MPCILLSDGNGRVMLVKSVMKLKIMIVIIGYVYVRKVQRV